jgi:two-component system, chemotaxis family, chemotaxis protein CheY
MVPILDVISPGTRALIVEDSRATRRIFRSLAEELGMVASEAGDGEEALQAVQANPGVFDIIFTDISMPRMDGFELCHRLQQAEWFSGTPLVMVSTQSDAENVIRALKLGADDYLPKPFDKDVLARITGRVLAHV